MSFINPGLLYWLPAALVVPLLLVGLNFWRARRLLSGYGDWKLIAKSSRPVPCWRYALKALSASLCASALIVALARPFVDDGTTTISQGTVDVVAVIDVSRSMAAMDYEGKVPLSVVPKDLITPEERYYNYDQKPKQEVQVAGTRLEMVRHVILNHMLAQLDGNQLGIVSYAGEAYPQSFLTRDTSSLHWVIDRGLTVSSAPGEGSNMTKALELALALFEVDSPADHERVLILFSDGGSEDKAANLAELADEFKQRRIKVIVVGLGNTMPAMIPVNKLAKDDEVAEALMLHGKKWYEVDGQVEKTGMNKDLLQALAKRADGSFVHLHEATDLDMRSYVGQQSLMQVPGTRELFPYALTTALVSLLIMVVTGREWRRKAL